MNKYEPFWQEVSVKSLILRWPLRPVSLLFLLRMSRKRNIWDPHWYIDHSHFHATSIYIGFRHLLTLGYFKHIAWPVLTIFSLYCTQHYFVGERKQIQFDIHMKSDHFLLVHMLSILDAYIDWSCMCCWLTLNTSTQHKKVNKLLTCIIDIIWYFKN